MATLGKLAVGLSEDRGPDAIHTVAVPAQWLGGGVTLEVELPRRARCARCEGGGCDACGRSGVLLLHDVGGAGKRVQVRVSSPTGQACVVRLPEQGPPGISGQSAGCLLLRVNEGPLSAGVHKIGRAHNGRGVAPGLALLSVALLVLAGIGSWLVSR